MWTNDRRKMFVISLVVIVGASAFAGCFGTTPPPPPPNTPPTAFPSTDVSLASVGDVIPFTATGTDFGGSIVKWTWNFGDGTNATVQNPDHVYQHQGVYYVTLNVTDNGGLTYDSISQTALSQLRIDILPKFASTTPEDTPLAELSLWSPSAVIQPNTQLSWSALSSAGSWNAEAAAPGTITDYTMDYGDGSSTSHHAATEIPGTWDGNFTHTYTASGSFAAHLTVTSNTTKTDMTYWTVLVAATVPVANIKNPKTLIIETFGQPEFLDPAIAYDDASGQIIQAVYETLVTYDGAHVDQFVPLLAESIPTTGNGISADGMNYTFMLRHGIKFSSGDDFNADDVVVSFQRVIQINDPGSAAWILTQVMNVNSIVKDNDYQVTFHLTRAYGAFVSMLAYTVAAVVSNATLAAHGGVTPGAQNTYMNKNMDGTGPWIFKSWVPAQQIVLDRNPNYWNTTGAAKLDHVIIKYVTAFSTRLLDLRSGNADIITVPGVNRPEVQAVAANPTEKIDVNLGASTWSILTGAFNFNINTTQRSAMGSLPNPDNVPTDFFQDAHMRKAFALAFDYSDYITNVAKGLAFRLAGIIPKGMYGYNDALGVPNFDLNAARAEYNMSAWVTGGNYATGFNLTVGYNSGNTNRQQASLILQRGVEALGPNIHINVKDWEWSTYLGLTLHTASGVPGPVGVFFIGWGPDYADPDDYVVPFAQTGGTYPQFTGFSNTTLDALITSAGGMPNSATRLDLYNQIQTSVINDNVYLLITEAKNFHVAKTWVHGWYYNPMLSGSDLGSNMANIVKS
jgi:peptide/nickel transport system substrate-binding protein